MGEATHHQGFRHTLAHCLPKNFQTHVRLPSPVACCDERAEGAVIGSDTANLQQGNTRHMSGALQRDKAYHQQTMQRCMMYLHVFHHSQRLIQLARVPSNIQKRIPHGDICFNTRCESI